MTLYAIESFVVPVKKGIRRKLLQESGLTLSKCVDICRANEATAAQLKDMAPSQTTEQEANAVNSL